MIRSRHPWGEDISRGEESPAPWSCAEDEIFLSEEFSNGQNHFLWA